MIKGEYILIVISAIWIVVDIIIGSKLFEYNHTFTKWLQGNMMETNAPRFVVFKIITQFGYQHIVGALIAFGFIAFPNKIQALKIVLYTLFSSYLLSLLKLIYHDPRPYFVYPDLHGIGCDYEFGKPSGHAMVTLVLYYLLFDAFINKRFFDFSNSIRFLSGNREIGHVELVKVVIHEKEEQGNQIVSDEIKQDKFVSNFFLMTFYVIWIFLIGFSRVILGAHSFNQVILGWSYGIICVCLFRLKLDEMLENILLIITHKGFTSQRHFNQYVIYMVLGYVLLVGLNLIAYNLVDQKITQEERDRYTQNILTKSYCSTFRPNNLKFLADKCFSDSVTAAFIFGILITITYTKGTYNPQKWSENFTKISHFRKVIRVIIMGFVCVVPFLCTFFLKLENIYLHYFFKASLQAFLVGFTLIKIAPWAKRLAKVDIDGDFLQLINEQVFYDSSFTEKDFVYSYQK